MSIREVRQRLSEVVRTARNGTDVYVGAYRHPDAVLISLRRYRELTVREHPVDPIDIGPDDPEPAPLDDEVAAARDLARGRIAYHEYLHRVRGLNTGVW